MGIISEGLQHNQRAHAAAMMGEVTWIEKASLLRPLSEDDEARKLAITREMIAGRRAVMGTTVDDEPEGDSFVAFTWFLAGVIMTSILILGAWVRFGG